MFLDCFSIKSFKGGDCDFEGMSDNNFRTGFSAECGELDLEQIAGFDLISFLGCSEVRRSSKSPDKNYINVINV